MKIINQQHIGHSSLIACNVIWGAAVPISKFILMSGIITSTVLADIRLIAGTVLFWLAGFCIPSERTHKVERKDYLKLILAAFFSSALLQFLYMKGVSLTSPVDATICTTTLPIWTMILSSIWLHEKITTRKAGGILIGLSGALLLILWGSGLATGSSHNVLGVVCCLLSQVSYGIYLVFFQDIIKKYSSITLMKWKHLFGAMMLLPFSFKELITIYWMSIDSTLWLALVFVMLFSTFLSYFLVPFGQKYLRPTVVAMYNYLQTVTAAAIAVIMHQDGFSLVKTAAVLLVFLGVWLVSTPAMSERVRKPVK